MTDNNSKQKNDETNVDELFPEATDIRLDSDASIKTISIGEVYVSEVNNIQDYGIFVELREKPAQISGLMHINNLPPMTTIGDYSIGDIVLVELIDKKPDGDLAFNGVKAPNIAPDAPREPIENRPEEPEETISAKNISKRLEAIEENIRDLTTQVESEAKPKSESSEDSNSELGMVKTPINDAIDKLQRLDDIGYSVTTYQTTTEDESVTINIELEQQSSS